MGLLGGRERQCRPPRWRRTLIEDAVLLGDGSIRSGMWYQYVQPSYAPVPSATPQPGSLGPGWVLHPAEGTDPGAIRSGDFRTYPSPCRRGPRPL